MFQQLFVLIGQKTAVQIAGSGNLQQPAGVPDDGFGKEPAPGKYGERVAKGGWVGGDFTSPGGRFRQQAIHEMYRIVRIRQRRKQRRNGADRRRRECSQVYELRSRTNRVAKLDLFEEIQHYIDYRGLGG